ncbi:MAG: class I SAM-dependent DNA methyltransferase [Chloroflexi bacterium]|nr:class I SAM-dependent DNA methyltransferase [Chloroflexota bacterium]
MPLTPDEFVAHWSDSTRNEIQGYQSHFLQLCQLVGFDPNEPRILTSDAPILFEENVPKADGAVGRADVYRPRHFAWEYKAKGRNLDLAYSQLVSYAPGLNNPPLLIVCDFEEFRIFPQWPNIDHQPWVFRNTDLRRQEIRDLVYAAIADPERLQRQRLDAAAQRERVTEQLAGRFADLAVVLRDEKEGGDPSITPMQVARFLTKLIFAIFAEDVGLLPRVGDQPVLEYIVDTARSDPASFHDAVAELFQGMAGQRNRVFAQPIAYFNGGLFDANADDVVIDLTTNANARNILYEVNRSDWRWVSPSIFGTVFERALDPSKRAQLGAHYTSEDDIRLVIDPVLMQPLRRKWDAIIAETGALWPELDKSPREADAARRQLAGLYDDMLAALRDTTVLDPACGSGNFLYMSLRAMKDLEDKVHEHFKPLGLPRRDTVTPLQLYGIELNTFAAELARVVVWIGYLQWRFARDGYLKPQLPGRPPEPDALPSPIIADDGTEHIENADAILRAYDGRIVEPEWPSTTVIVGNPPFLGGNKIRGELGDYVDTLFDLYEGRIPAFADLVCYWFEKARSSIEAGRTQRAGLIATNSIRGGANRVVLERIKQSGDIFMAWSDRPWLLDGASVRVSIVGFGFGGHEHKLLDDRFVGEINSDLSATVDVQASAPLPENAGVAFRGVQKGGPFDIPENTARAMIEKVNASKRSNAEVVRPSINGNDVASRWQNRWIINFGDMSIDEAEAFTAPFEYAKIHVKPTRDGNPVRAERENWWRPLRSRPEMRRAIAGMARFLATPHVSKHRLIVWLDANAVPDHQLIVVARDDDYAFGVLQSYVHDLWSLRLGTSLGPTPRYTPSTSFETFPFPYPPGHEPGRPEALYADRALKLATNGTHHPGEGPASAQARAVRAIASLAATLHRERDLWLNPPDVDDPSVLRKLTLTNLYNALADHRAGKPLSRELFPFNGVQFVPRLRELHDELDAAVLAAYGWTDLADALRTPAGDEELLSRLLAENLRRASNEAEK